MGGNLRSTCVPALARISGAAHGFRQRSSAELSVKTSETMKRQCLWCLARQPNTALSTHALQLATGLQENKPPQSGAPHGHYLTAKLRAFMLLQMSDAYWCGQCRPCAAFLTFCLGCLRVLVFRATIYTCLGTIFAIDALDHCLTPHADLPLNHWVTPIFIEPLILARDFGAFPSYPWVLRRSRAVCVAQGLVESSPDLDEHFKARLGKTLSRGRWSAERV